MGREPYARRSGRAAESTSAPQRLAALAAEARRLHDESEEAWRKLIAYGHRRKRLLLAKRASSVTTSARLPGEELSSLLDALQRIEGRLGTISESTSGRSSADPGASGVPSPAGGEGAAIVPPAAREHAAPPAERLLRDYADPELVRAREALGARLRAIEEELIRRYIAAEKELGRLARTRETRRKRRPPRVRSGSGESSAAPRRTAILAAHGSRGLFVRRSKVALARYLADKGHADHRALGRRLRRELVRPHLGATATPAWIQAVTAAQHLSGRRVTGELDASLSHLLLPYWPRDNFTKRLARSTPAWRAIPGQLTRNFNVKEFACADNASTPYIRGLMREQGLSKRDARARARQLALRLERVRLMSGSRPLVIVSAFRTKAYNALRGDAAINSSHTRGYAADVPPPPGVTLDEHHLSMTIGFERSVHRGDLFLHGDFDPTLSPQREMLKSRRAGLRAGGPRTIPSG